MKPHPIVHIEIPAENPAESAEFFKKALGWDISVDDSFDYHMFAAEGGPAGGFVKPSDGYNIGHVIIYLETDDIEATLAQIEAEGGKATKGKTEILGIGWFAEFTDPAGNRMALYTSARSQG